MAVEKSFDDRGLLRKILINGADRYPGGDRQFRHPHGAYALSAMIAAAAAKMRSSL